MAVNPVVLDLVWEGEQRLRGQVGDVTLTLDGSGKSGPSPVQAVALGLASCMALDLVHILTRGRTEPKALRVHLIGHRRDSEPRRFLSFELRFTVEGDVPPERVARAIELSRETYCSVWHSLAKDIALETAFEIVPA